MPDHIASLPFWEGFSVTSFTQSGQSVSIRLEPCPSTERVCRHCSSVAPKAEARPKRLVMDEFALFKGHRYATVVLDADSRQVLWVGEGRSREAIRPFFTWLGVQRCQAIEVVAMDMSTAFDLEVRKQCPNARVVYDLFSTNCWLPMPA